MSIYRYQNPLPSPLIYCTVYCSISNVIYQLVNYFFLSFWIVILYQLSFYAFSGCICDLSSICKFISDNFQKLVVFSRKVGNSHSIFGISVNSKGTDVLNWVYFNKPEPAPPILTIVIILNYIVFLKTSYI